jgi:predicted transcriptional regulator
MARPRTTELTDRELAIMQVFWADKSRPPSTLTAEAVRDALQANGESLAYVTVANAVRGLAEKGFLEQTNEKRPFHFKAMRTFESISNRLVMDLVRRLFAGSREAMLVQLLDRRKLTASEREYLQSLLNDSEDQ